jgi:hypothetical protein
VDQQAEDSCDVEHAVHVWTRLRNLHGTAGGGRPVEDVNQLSDTRRIDI